MKTRTSTTHPLRIDVVEVPTTGGQIGMTLFPGRRDGLSAVAAWDRDLSIDLAVVRAWNPAIVISVVEEFEFSLLGVPQYGEVMRAFSDAERVTWILLPIPDGGVPDARFEAAWLEAGRSARAALGQAGRFCCTAVPV